MNLLEWAQNYWPYDEEEGADKEAFIQFLEQRKKASLSLYKRENLVGHITVSCWIVNQKRTCVLMGFHNLYKHWGWLGGHADGNEDLIAVARKEISEECGLKDAKLLCDEPIDFCILGVGAHYKNSRQVPAHLHFNFTYLFEADENLLIRPKTDENKAVSWIDNRRVIAVSNEEATAPVYARIMEKIKERSL